jgi:hypothetical protein
MAELVVLAEGRGAEVYLQNDGTVLKLLRDAAYGCETCRAGRRVKVGVLLALLGCILCSCTSASHPRTVAKPRSEVTTSIASPPTTTVPVITTTSLPCPPGCEYAADYDAITVLASSANVVALVTVTQAPHPAQTDTAVLRVDSVLQGNPNGVLFAPTLPGLSSIVGNTGQVVTGGQYLVFASYDRGGPCVSALFAYSATTQQATLLANNDGYNGDILLPGRTLLVPNTISLEEVQKRMNPTGGVIYPTNSSESLCPGP